VLRATVGRQGQRGTFFGAWAAGPQAHSSFTRRAVRPPIAEGRTSVNTYFYRCAPRRSRPYSDVPDSENTDLYRCGLRRHFPYSCVTRHPHGAQQRTETHMTERRSSAAGVPPPSVTELGPHASRLTAAHRAAAGIRAARRTSCTPSGSSWTRFTASRWTSRTLGSGRAQPGAGQAGERGRGTHTAV
jgi:hypothetical protein